MDKQQKAAPMRYADARALIETGDLIAVRDTNGWLGRLVQIVTRRPHTHTGVAYWVKDRLFMAGLNSGRNHLTAVSQLGDFDVCAPPAGLDRNTIELATEFWLDQRIEYGYAALIGIGLECLLRMRTLFDNWRNVIVCSGGSVQIYESAAHLMAAQGKKAPEAWLKHSRMLAPGELVDELTLKLAVRGVPA